MKHCWTKLLAVAGAFAACMVANAFIYDATILIDRALNSPTLTIRYTGASAALAELRVNGVSYGTRTLNSGSSSGETNFTLDLSALNLGDNQVEVRLFDKAGKVVGTERTTISADDGSQSPVFVSAPKMGSTVQGPVEIKVGFGRSIRNMYVSFFIDNQFKSMTNVPPYSYLWDTQRDANGWHELEAWVVDDSSNTLKTKKIRVFVNNPGGRTVRKTEEKVEGTTSENKVLPVAGNPGTIKPTVEPGKAVLGNPGSPKVPTTEPLTSANPVEVKPAAAAGTKPIQVENAIATGAKSLTPTGQRVAAPPAKPVEKVAPKVVPTVPEKVARTAPPVVTSKVATKIDVSSPSTSVATTAKAGVGLLRLAKGDRVPNIGTYAILMDSKYVEFDVQPRVENGIPLAPIRHLLEAADGKVAWENIAKVMTAEANGRTIVVHIGDTVAHINNLPVSMEIAPFLERGRTIVPLSFLRDSLDVEIEFDAKTGHVLITSAPKK
ncbi:MAG: stalk domain-containing protein [Fimbriimonadaceae bacterium]|nr:hypothetical protein [Chthonomonadaceae bacterium]MCO5295800.1 stalk domain-containing protein [Fimbriimonadaceae bacterium]